MHGTVDLAAATMANSDAKRLYDDLLRKSGYNKLIRPVINNTDKLIVKLGLRLSQLIDVVRIKYSILFDILRRLLYVGLPVRLSVSLRVSLYVLLRMWLP